MRREARAIRRATVGTHVDPEKLTALTGKLIFELFSGSGRLARTCAKRGFSAKTYDWKDDPNQDFLDDAEFRKICSLVRGRKITLLWIALPCCTWSRARRPGFGKPQLRSDRYLMGWPDLKGKARANVKLHNRILYRVAELVQLCIDCGVDWCIENPASSRVWLTRPILKLLPMCEFVTFDFCQYGEPWRKRTSIATSLPCLAAISKLCSSSAHYPCCSRTGKRHLQLSGVDPATKQFRTLLACPYPRPLVRRIADILGEHYGG